MDPNSLKENIHLDPNLSLEEKQRLSREASPSFTTSFSHLARATLERLNNYKGDQADIRDPSFSSLSQEQKYSIYSATLKAINEIGGESSIEGFLKNKTIALVGEPGVFFENNKLKIGLGVTKEEIINFIEEKAIKSIKKEDMDRDIGTNDSSLSKQSLEVVSESNADEIIERVEPESTKEDLTRIASEKIYKSPEEAGYIAELSMKPVNPLNEPKVPEVTPIKPEAVSIMPKAKLETKIDISGIDKIREWKDMNENEIKISDRVKWDFYGGFDEGEITSFVSRNGHTLAHINTIGGTEVEINTRDIYLVKKPKQIEASSELAPDADQITKPDHEMEDLTELASQENITEEILPDEEINNEKTGLKTEPQQSEQILTSEIVENKRGNIPDWENSEEWKELERLREISVKSELFRAKVGDSILNEDEKTTEGVIESYKSQKELVAKKIEETLRIEMGTNILTPEQEAELRSKINNTLFEELVKKENDIYTKSTIENREKTWTDKLKIETAKVLSTKIAQWYLGLTRTQRIGVSLAIAGIAGFAFGTNIGALGVTGYLGKRALTAFSGLGMGELVNKKKSWSLEEINKHENEEMEVLRNSDISLEQKSKKELEIRNKYKKERTKAAILKIGLTAAAGFGTGFFANFVEDAFAGAGPGGAVKTALESKGRKASSFVENKLPPRKGFEPNQKYTVSVSEQVIPEAGKLFEDSSVLKHEAVAGDSLWKILKETLNNNDQFKGMTGAQKTYVLSAMTNKALQNPEEYGLGNGGDIYIGDKVDFTKLFDNDKEINSIFEKARQTVAEGSPQEASILEQEAKISEWVKNNPGAKLTSDRIPEILSSKPKVEDILPSENLNEAPVSTSEPESQVEPELQLEANNVTEGPTDVVGENDTNNNAEVLAGGVVLAGAGVVAGLSGSRAQIEKEMEEAKKRLQVLEGGRDKSKLERVVRNTNLERSFAKDLNNAKNGSELDRAVNAGKEETVNHFFTEGLIIKKEGIKSKKWKFIKGLSFKELEKYYKGDSNMSGLSLEAKNELNKSNRYKDFFEHVSWLKDQTGGAVILAEGEDPSIELVLEERGRYLLKNPQLAKLKKAA